MVRKLEKLVDNYKPKRGCICLDSLVLRVRYWGGVGGGGGGEEIHRKKTGRVDAPLYFSITFTKRGNLYEPVSQSMNESVRESVTALGVTSHQHIGHAEVA